MKYLIAAIVLFTVSAWAQTNTSGIWLTNTTNASGLIVSNVFPPGPEMPTNIVPVVTAPSAQTAQGLLLALIPVAVPLIVAFLKWAMGFLPKWTLPILAALIGEAINWISGMAGGPSTSVLGGLLLGSAGVGLREVLDQAKTRMKDGPQPPPS